MTEANAEEHYYRASFVLFLWPSNVALDLREDLRTVLSLPDMIEKRVQWAPSRGMIELFEGTTRAGEVDLYFSEAQLREIIDTLHRSTRFLYQLPHERTRYGAATAFRAPPAAVVFTSAEHVHATLRRHQKLNRRTVGKALKQQQLTLDYRLARKAWRESTGSWLAIDVEAWEKDQSVITEIGCSSVRFKAKKGSAGVSFKRDDKHFIIEENSAYVNGTYVADAKHKFRFGASTTLKLAEAVTNMQAILHYLYVEFPPLHLVFHSASNELAYFEKLGIHLPAREHYRMYDIAELYAEHKNEGAQRHSLQRLGGRLGITCLDCHNAGIKDFYFF